MADNELPKPLNFLLEVPVYRKFTFSGPQVWEILNLLYFEGTYDSYCTKCKRDSTFQVLSPDRPPEHKCPSNYLAAAIPYIRPDVYRISARCTRENIHFQYFMFLIDCRPVEHPTEKRSSTAPVPGYMLGAPFLNQQPLELGYTIQKIGQHPSYGDLNLPRFKKYATILDKPKFRELTRAVGLASHDVGIGSYVYLRRVFEAFIEEAHQIEVSEANWDEEDENGYKKSRMSEKIDLLKHRLPDFLVENRNMYALLSKGVHELSEDECLSHFDLLLTSIELILGEKLERKEKQKKIHEAKSALSKAAGEINKSSKKA
jgi:hypothetical protein